MKLPTNGPWAAPEGIVRLKVRGRLFRKYVALFTSVVCAALVMSGLFDIWFSYREQKTLLIRIQRQQAEAAALRIGQFIKEIEGQMAWATQLPWSADTIEEWRYNAVRLLRQVPAITEVNQLDSSGREQARMSRLAMDVFGSQADLSQDPAFIGANANKIYYGPIYFLRESEPYMTLAMAGVRPEYGVIVAQANLRFIWDVVSETKVGIRGQAYVVDPQARLIAHRDISIVLRNTDLSRLAQVQAARSEVPPEQEPVGNDIQGREVLSAHALVPALGWIVFVDLPVDEAYAPLYASIQRSAALLVAALVLATFAGLYLARRMVVPIQALRDGAARIGSGDLTQRIAIKTGDELEALGNQFNSMAAELQDSYATLERKVKERTHQLEMANLAKSRFLAAASHDLRQPLHALGLFVAQLRSPKQSTERERIIEQIEASVTAMNELFSELLDISKLDAGVLPVSTSDFPVARVLKRIETTFFGASMEKGLSLRIMPTTAWVRSDAILVERVLLNLVSNAVRYTSHGGVLVGCRRRGGDLHIEIYDTGPGIPEDQRQKIFDEFYRFGSPDRDGRAGLGLGLAIVERLSRLLKLSIQVTSTVGRGSRFTVVVPRTAARAENDATPMTSPVVTDAINGRLIVIIEDDPLVLDGMGGLLRGWGCHVVSASSSIGALAGIGDSDRPPDLIVSDYRLPDGRTGVEAIEHIRSAFSSPIPAFLLSGDTNPDLLRYGGTHGFHLLHKPVDPMTLRAMLNQMLRKNGRTGANRTFH
jgi:signal transduction histidine kinase